MAGGLGAAAAPHEVAQAAACSKGQDDCHLAQNARQAAARSLGRRFQTAAQVHLGELRRAGQATVARGSNQDALVALGLVSEPPRPAL